MLPGPGQRLWLSCAAPLASGEKKGMRAGQPGSLRGRQLGGKGFTVAGGLRLLGPLGDRPHLLRGCSTGRAQVPGRPQCPPGMHSSCPPRPFTCRQGNRGTGLLSEQSRVWSRQERLTQGSAPPTPTLPGASPGVSVQELQTTGTGLWSKKELDLRAERRDSQVAVGAATGWGPQAVQ